MLSYCLKEKNAENKNLKLSKTSDGKVMLLSKSAMCNNKNSRFIKEQGVSRLLSQLGIRNPLSKIPLLRDFFVKDLHYY